MTGLVKAEFRKLLSTQVWFWLLLASMAVAALSVIGPLASSSTFSSDDVANLFAAGRSAYVGAFVLGMLAVTTEFRYQTITPTFLATPNRWSLITAKMISYALTGVLYALASLVVSLVIAVPWLNSKGVDYSFSGDHVLRSLIAVFGIVLLYALLGLGVGAFVRNQIVAVVVGVIYVLAVEPLLSVIPIVRNAYKFLPGGAQSAIVTPHGNYGDGTYEYFGTWTGVIILLVWALALSVAGAAFSMNRDIT